MCHGDSGRNSGMQGGVSPGDPWGPFSGLKTMNDIIIGWVEILTDYHPILHAITF